MTFEVRDTNMYSIVAPPEQQQSDKQAKNTNKRPSGVSESNWTKFQELKTRREKLCKTKRSGGKRRQELRKKAVEPVLSQLQSEEEDISVVRNHGVGRTASHKSSEWDKKCTSEATKKPQSCTNEEKWNELRKYLPQASKSDTPSTAVSCEKSTEQEITDAIKKGHFKEAESLSEQLTTQDFAAKVASAIQSRDFAEKREIEEHDKTKKRKKKKLHWGFEQKQRWESKGNM